MKTPSLTGPPPVISLESNNVVAEIDKACSSWGAFTLVDHGLDETVLKRVMQIGHEFFHLPESTKEKYSLQKHGAKWRGYMRVGGERSQQGEFIDLKEGLYLGDEHDVNDPHLGLPTFGSNVFPQEEIPNMKPVFLEYHDKMKDLGNRIMRILSQALGLSEDYIETHVTRNDPVILPRMFRYLPQQQAHSEHSVENVSEEKNDTTTTKWGIGRHSDYGLWTMILTDAEGLEFQHPTTGEWHALPLVPNGIIMNVGDVLDRLTAGRFISAYHRARNHSATQHRLSLPFFYDPAWDARMTTLPIDQAQLYDTPERAARWSNTKITCEFDGSVEYSEFLAKKVAKVFPDLVPESVWKNLSSTSEPSTRHALVVQSPDIVVTEQVVEQVKQFYQEHPEIKASHGWQHVSAVYQHASKAIACHNPALSSRESMQIKLAALLHDVDDPKYFPNHSNLENARSLMEAHVPQESVEPVLSMIRLVSCSANGNHVPQDIIDSGNYHLLIPRWADRLEAVGAKGVVRCYQYNQEKHRPLCSPRSPRAESQEQVWEYARPERFEEYQKRGGTSTDMISHYYDKLLHVACPPKEIVQNPYLEQMAEKSSNELVEVCVRFGRTGVVDEEHIQIIATKLSTVEAP